MDSKNDDKAILGNRRHVLFNDRDYNALNRIFQWLKELLKKLF